MKVFCRDQPWVESARIIRRNLRSMKAHRMLRPFGYAHLKHAILWFSIRYPICLLLVDLIIAFKVIFRFSLFYLQFISLNVQFISLWLFIVWLWCLFLKRLLLLFAGIVSAVISVVLLFYREIYVVIVRVEVVCFIDVRWLPGDWRLIVFYT